MTLEKAIENYKFKEFVLRSTDQPKQAAEYEQLTAWLEMLKKIQDIVNAPEYMPQEVQIRYYAICEVLKDGNRESNGNF